MYGCKDLKPIFKNCYELRREMTRAALMSRLFELVVNDSELFTLAEAWHSPFALNYESNDAIL